MWFSFYGGCLGVLKGLLSCYEWLSGCYGWLLLVTRLIWGNNMFWVVVRVF